MARVQISVDPAIVQGLFQRDDGLARLVESVLNQMLGAQVAEQLGAQRYQRTDERQGYLSTARRRGTIRRWWSAGNGWGWRPMPWTPRLPPSAGPITLSWRPATGRTSRAPASG